MSTRFEYSRQARTYDNTRGASPSVLAPLLEALGGAGGKEPIRLLDVGGGTGNYAAALTGHGFAPTVLDLNEAMLARARAKGLAVVVADAQALPYADGSWGAITMIAMLHHVQDWRGALAEARRVLAPHGRLAVMGWAREHVEQVSWVHSYWPSTRAWMDEIHEPLSSILAELPGARVLPVRFGDFVDLSLGALQRRPELLLDEDMRRQTSYFERLAASDADELRAGIELLRADLAAGHDPRTAIEPARERLGDAFVLAWAQE